MYSSQSLEKLRLLIESLKRYNRCDLRNEFDKSIIDDVYVDPLPNEGVLKYAMGDNTCFFTGRKGTGKSTVFLVAQKRIRESKNNLAIYIDVKSIFAQAQLTKLETRKYTDALGAEAIDGLTSYLIHKAFISQFLNETINEITSYLKLGLAERLFTDREIRVEKALEQLFTWSKKVLDENTYRDIPMFIEAKIIEKGATKDSAEDSNAIHIDGEGSFSLTTIAAKLGFGIKSKTSRSILEETSQELQKEYKEILTLFFDIKSLLGPIAKLLKDAGFTKLFIFLDDFSEIEEESAVRMIMDVLIAPLNNWSNDFYKLKIAAYPERIYYGSIDKSKIDEVSLDFYDLYASKKLTELEQKAIDFTRRIIEQRSIVFLDHDFLEYVDPTLKTNFYEELFKATMNNPRRMGYLLLYCLNNQIVHGNKITITAFREATIKLYKEKDEAVFKDNVKIQQAFGERLMVQSQKELLNALVARAKELARDLPKEGSELLKKLPQIFTSHFFILKEFEFLMGTLEHNFFLSKYHELKDRDGREITIYALNYGLCQREGILFGRPEKTEEGKYLTERVFNYLPTIQSFLQKFIIIKCPVCKKVYPTEQLQALKLYNMLCYACMNGKCELTLGYKTLVEEINKRYLEIQIPEIEFEILKVIYESREINWYPSLIAAEIDRSYQSVTKLTEKLIGRTLLKREKKYVNGQDRTIYSLTEAAKEKYFNNIEENLF